MLRWSDFWPEFESGGKRRNRCAFSRAPQPARPAMLHLFAAALIAAAPAPRSDDVQVLAGADFESLARTVEARCPLAPIRTIKPAELLYAEELFEEALPKARQDALNQVRAGDPGVVRCADRDGASCSAVANLHVYQSAAVMPGFIDSLCRHGAAPWR